MYALSLDEREEIRKQKHVRTWIAQSLHPTRVMHEALRLAEVGQRRPAVVPSGLLGEHQLAHVVVVLHPLDGLR